MVERPWALYRYTTVHVKCGHAKLTPWALPDGSHPYDGWSLILDVKLPSKNYTMFTTSADALATSYISGI